MSVKKRLVLTFDAFGTLFKPRGSIGKAYANVAGKRGVPGLAGLDPEQLKENFTKAFMQAEREHPNYGKATGLDPNQWWTNIIKATFAPVVKPSDLPKEVIQDLLRLYGTAEGYRLYPDVLPFFNGLRNFRLIPPGPKAALEITVGIITNSDDRVLSILNSLSLDAPQRRFLPGVAHDVFIKRATNTFDFIVLSYDVGVAKPDRRIFDAAKLCAALPNEEGGIENIYVHVGDNPIKDCQAATEAGWKGVCVGGFGRNRGKIPENTSIFFLKNLYELNMYIFQDILGLEHRRREEKHT